MSLTTLDLESAIRRHVSTSSDPLATIQHLRSILHDLSPLKAMPVDLVTWVPLDRVHPNDYNPNSVAQIELQLLHTSIAADGYTQPCVVCAEPDGQLAIVDGFHRYFVLKSSPDLLARTGGYLPVSIIDKPINDRMASTIRHNRARGKHSIQGMSSLVFKMLDGGWDDASICNELGMEPDEILRLKHLTGFSKLFADREYNKSWLMRRQILYKEKWDNAHPDDPKEVLR